MSTKHEMQPPAFALHFPLSVCTQLALAYIKLTIPASVLGEEDYV